MNANHLFGRFTINNIKRKFPVEGLRDYIVKAFYEEEEAESTRPATPTKLSTWISSYQSSNEELRIKQFADILQEQQIDIESLRTLSYHGIPEKLRAIVWKLLLGYLPANKAQQSQEMCNRRKEYFEIVHHTYPLTKEDKVIGEPNPLWDQIYVDVIRTFPPGMENFCENQVVREVLCRILYVYSVVHQRGNYWQGLNELPIPFLLTFATFYADCSLRQLNSLSGDVIERLFASGSLESDAYWCLCRFVNGLQLQGNFVVQKYGAITQDPILQRFILLCRMCDDDLVENLNSKGVEFIFFAFRWMVCLLTRELPVGVIIRLWDSYMSEGEGILSFHLYTALSFMLTFAKQIKEQDGFEGTLSFLQRIPTEDWTEIHAEYLIASADQIKAIDKFYQDTALDVATFIISAFFTSVSVHYLSIMLSD